MRSRTRIVGFTLIELVVAIVVIGITGATLVGLLTFISKRSAEGMTHSQSAALAETYFGQIMSQAFSVSGYMINNAIPTDAFGNPIAALTNYRVSMSVQPAALGSISALNCRLIIVTVTDPFGEQVVVSGYKTVHP